MKLCWLDTDNRRDAYIFYKRFLPYARLSKKERVGVLYARKDVDERQVIAAVRLRPIGSFTLLTGMLVHPYYREQGLAHQIMTSLAYIFENNRTFLFSLPSLVGFYRQHQFMPTDDVPNDILQLFSKYRGQGKELVLMKFSDDLK
ncbi:GCN5-related N-acetyltransferase [Shewanella sediminis HAW-EB3]|uniref:GCN5-related N-acetyltransferase n=1 Tax=Shewanella sediminis (strain HAW-EB3) TaxID=425104 RepID=A8FSQ3_SHESH|nr:GNAT family N-acetyltransferase [Shewanella sediminis]ABV35876.1 GCN5-related N-acetyltransferase [Shewanella sediminis HAW-EB3]